LPDCKKEEDAPPPTHPPATLPLATPELGRRCSFFEDDNDTILPSTTAALVDDMLKILRTAALATDAIASAAPEDGNIGNCLRLLLFSSLQFRFPPEEAADKNSALRVSEGV
jgi:hypothetical protein